MNPQYQLCGYLTSRNWQVRGRRGKGLPITRHASYSVLMVLAYKRHAPAALSPGKSAVQILHESGRAPDVGVGWRGEQTSRPQQGSNPEPSSS